VLVTFYEVRKRVNFPFPVDEPWVWGRSIGTRGCSKGDRPYKLPGVTHYRFFQYEEGWCEPVEGTLSPTGVTLRTYVCEMRSLSSGRYLGWWPCRPESVVFAYSVHGKERPVRDVGVELIWWPAGRIPYGTRDNPRCRVCNYGNQTVSYYVRLRIPANSYDERVWVSNHPPNEIRWVWFPPWEANCVGDHVVRCSTELLDDQNPNND